MSKVHRNTTRRPVPHELTLLAFTGNSDGTVSICDIVETCSKNAKFFARRWVRDPAIAEIAAAAPGSDLLAAKRHRLPGREART